MESNVQDTYVPKLIRTMVKDDSPAAPSLVRQLGLSGVVNGATAANFCSNTSTVSGHLVGSNAVQVVLPPPSSRFSTSSLLHSLQSPAIQQSFINSTTGVPHRQAAANRYATSSHLPHFDRKMFMKMWCVVVTVTRGTRSLIDSPRPTI
ncbi:hypothetical protein KIN20_031573 [Parelaphostrongylus tenuis]|uniref:Uncharacterized protein n=1 Tax=Parelaphostrongylus tenuis TaxID=148309 RepID=A0AAD5R5V2_PARTN|nr:hypothetical protein KIN20_031573 [Parelaphostrongylus tenuis]